MSGTSLTLEVPTEQEGERLDRFLAGALDDRTRSALRRMIADGRVDVDGVAATKAGLSLRGGSRVDVRLPEAAEAAPGPEEIPVDAVHEDDDLIVVHKPAGMVVHPAHGATDGTLVNALLGRGTPLAPAGGVQRPGIVHRLDRDTSGLLIVAKTDAAHRGLTAAFAERRVHKTYLALVWGHPRPGEGTIERRIGRSRANPTRMCVGGRGSREAESRYRTLESLASFAWLEVQPVTGRTHQIRVHLASIRHPIVGDSTYGGQGWRGIQDPLKRKALRAFERLALHAWRLRFDHPVSGHELRLEIPVPDELAGLLDALRAQRGG
jgi:23S rRNA pseudouridine1911/1915/1917 synthase